MWQYVLLVLQRQRSRSILASGGFLLAACALILLSATTQTTVLQANRIISRNWRSTYDMVVLPPQANVPSGKAVPADLLEGYGGGISVQQYQQIKQLPGVDVAAPIAFIGYVQMPEPDVKFITLPAASGYYRVDTTLTSFDGKHQIIERQDSRIFYFSSSCDAINQEQSALGTLQTQGIEVGGCGSNLGALEFPLVESGTFLLAAIDPTAENQLIHLDKSTIRGRMITSQDTVRIDPNNPSISFIAGDGGTVNVPNYDVPLVINTPLPGKIMLNLSLTQVTSDTLDPQQVLNHGGFSYLTHLSGQKKLFQGPVPIVQNDPGRFSSLTLDWDGHSWQNEPFPFSGLGMLFLYTPSGLSYQAILPPPGQLGLAYTLVPSETQNPKEALSKLHLPSGEIYVPSDKQGAEVAFRTLRPLHVAATAQSPYIRANYIAVPVGQFSGNDLNAQFSNLLNWLPENTYGSPPVILRYDAQGRPVQSTNLLPTTSPTSYILQPPLALTTLAAAQNMVGDHLISAIRVRVAGVDPANEASWTRIEKVAQMIQQHTGLRVLVTLGSSPQPTLVYVPGIKQGEYGSTRTIDPVGWVEERWIFIGAGIVYLNQLGITRLLLLGAVLLVCLGYLVMTLSALVSAQRREMAILSALGWRPWHPVSLFLSQILILAVGGGIVGIGLALLTMTLIGTSPPWPIVAWTLPVVLSLALLSTLYPLYQIWHIRPAEVLRAGTSVSMGRISHLEARLWWSLPPIASLALRNLARSRWQALIAIGSLFFSAALLTIMVEGILALRQTLQGTLLGDYVLLQTAVPQLAGAVFAVLLTFLSVADLLLLQVRERQREIGLLRAVGWRPGTIQQLFMQEGLTLALVGAIPGVLVALWVVATQHQTQGAVPAPLVALGAVGLMILVATLAALPAVRTANRVQVADVLKAD